MEFVDAVFLPARAWLLPLVATRFGRVFFSFRAKSQLYNQSSTHSNSHQPGFLTLIEGLEEERGLKNPVAPSKANIVYGCFGMI